MRQEGQQAALKQCVIGSEFEQHARAAVANVMFGAAVIPRDLRLHESRHVAQAESNQAAQLFCDQELVVEHCRNRTGRAGPESLRYSLGTIVVMPWCSHG